MSKFLCHCGKEFSTPQALGGHKGSHARTAEWHKDKRLAPETFSCKQCHAETPFGHSKKNVFCSIACKSLWYWLNKTVPIIQLGMGRSMDASTLKRYLREFVGDFCSLCKLPPVWNGKELVLQLDHIDGNSDNRVLSNIRLLCPNCHTQTPTFGCKGMGSRYKKVSKRNKYIQQYRGSLAQR